MASAGGNESLHEMAGIWKMLDEMSENNPKEYKKLMGDIINEGKENNMGPPLPHYVIETKKLPKVIPDLNYYINICGWSRLDKPTNTDNQVKILTSEFRKETNKNEIGCITDVIFSEAVFDKKYSKIFQREKLVEMSLRCLEDKYSLKLSRKYVTHDQKKYMGNQDNLLNFICPSTLKDTLKNSDDKVKVPRNAEYEKQIGRNDTGGEINDKSTKIQTKSQELLNIREIKSKKIRSNHLEEGQKLEKPKVEMILEKKNAEFRIYLPNVESVDECDLTVTEVSINLFVREKFELKLSLPLAIDTEGLGAKFVKDDEILILKTTLK